MKRTSVGVLLSSIFVVFLAYPAVSQQEDSLVGYWAFEEGRGDTVEDQSGQGNHGAISGEVDWVEGKAGTALEFSPGANVTIPDSDSLRDMDEYTIAMWVKLNSFAPDWNHIFEKDGSYGITMNTGSGDFRYTPNSSKVWIETKDKVEEDTWYYLTLRWDGSSVFFYINGDEVGQSDEAVVFNSNPINIAHSAPYTVDGAVDEVKFWAKALTPDEIVAAMEGGAAAEASREKLMATWAFIKSE